MKKLILLVMATVLVAGCKIDDLEFFGEERFIYFPTIDRGHVIHYTLGGLEEGEVMIPLKYSGRFYTEDKTYQVEVLPVTDSTGQPVLNAVEGVEFSLPEQLVFKTTGDRSRMYSDTLKLKIMKSERMDEEVLDIRLRLASNDNFTAAVRDSLVMQVKVTNMLTKPYWWTTEVEEAYLGEYSDLKYKLFMDNVYDGDYGALEAGEQYYYAVQFKKWLNRNPSYENGQRITVPVIGDE